jgi:hypothetical protein
MRVNFLLRTVETKKAGVKPAFRDMLCRFAGMVSCGSSKRFPISVHQLLLRSTNVCKKLKPACTIPAVSGSALLF